MNILHIFAIVCSRFCIVSLLSPFFVVDGVLLLLFFFSQQKPSNMLYILLVQPAAMVSDKKTAMTIQKGNRDNSYMKCIKTNEVAKIMQWSCHIGYDLRVSAIFFHYLLPGNFLSAFKFSSSVHDISVKKKSVNVRQLDGPAKCQQTKNVV